MPALLPKSQGINFDFTKLVNYYQVCCPYDFYLDYDPFLNITWTGSIECLPKILQESIRVAPKIELDFLPDTFEYLYIPLVYDSGYSRPYAVVYVLAITNNNSVLQQIGRIEFSLRRQVKNYSYYYYTIENCNWYDYDDPDENYVVPSNEDAQNEIVESITVDNIVYTYNGHDDYFMHLWVNQENPNYILTTSIRNPYNGYGCRIYNPTLEQTYDTPYISEVTYYDWYNDGASDPIIG